MSKLAGNLAIMQGLMAIQKDSMANVVSPPPGWKTVRHGVPLINEMVLFPDGTVRECRMDNDTVARTIVTRTRWRATGSGYYYYLNATGRPCRTRDVNRAGDNHAFDIGNYFRTREEADAKRAAFMKVFND